MRREKWLIRIGIQTQLIFMMMNAKAQKGKYKHELSDMLSQLTGSESDMAGIKEFQKLLGGL